MATSFFRTLVTKVMIRKMTLITTMMMTKMRMKTRKKIAPEKNLRKISLDERR